VVDIIFQQGDVAVSVVRKWPTPLPEAVPSPQTPCGHWGENPIFLQFCGKGAIIPPPRSHDRFFDLWKDLKQKMDMLLFPAAKD
jgi:hypothetical protein